MARHGELSPRQQRNRVTKDTMKLTPEEFSKLVARAESGELVRLIAVGRFPNATESELDRVESAIYDAMQYGEHLP